MSYNHIFRILWFSRRSLVFHYIKVNTTDPVEIEIKISLFFNSCTTLSKNLSNDICSLRKIFFFWNSGKYLHWETSLSIQVLLDFNRVDPFSEKLRCSWERSSSRKGLVRYQQQKCPNYSVYFDTQGSFLSKVNSRKYVLCLGKHGGSLLLQWKGNKD